MFQPTVTDDPPVAPADHPAVLLFRRIVDSRRRHDSRSTVLLTRQLRRLGWSVGMTAPGEGGGR